MSFPRPAPIYAWGEKPGPRRSAGEEHRRPRKEETAPVPAASPTSREGADSLAVEREALSFVRSFIQNQGQETAEKLHFVEKLDTICNAESIDGFRFYPSQLLIEVVKVLISWTESQTVLERERATEKLAQICYGVRTLCGYKETSAFPVLGQLVGCFALCHFDSSALVAQRAAEGLCHLYAFAARCKGVTPVEELNLSGLLQREWEDEEEEKLKRASVSHTKSIIEIFQKLLSPEELSGVFLTALSAFPEYNAHDTCAAVCLELNVRGVSPESLGRVTEEFVTFVHDHQWHHLHIITNPFARHEVEVIFRLLGLRHMSKLCDTLLRCSPECDRSAAAMWRSLVSSYYQAGDALDHLFTCLWGESRDPSASEEDVITLGLAASQVLAELLDRPCFDFIAALKARWERAFVALLLWMTRLYHHAGHKTIPGQPSQSPEPPSVWLARSAGRILRRLLERACPQFVPQESTTWELLSSAETFQDGVSLLAQAIDKPFDSELTKLAKYVMAVLDGPDTGQHGTALAILVELLHNPEVYIIVDQAVAHLKRHLSSPEGALHSLALDGLVNVAESPKKVRNPWPRQLEAVRKLLPLLPEAVASLQEADHPRAQRLFGQLHCWLMKDTSPPVAAEVAGHMPLLLDAELEYVRLFAFSTFQAMLEQGAEREVRHHALHSLVPLLLHLRDESPTVVEACWNIMPRIAIWLGHSTLQPLILDQDEEYLCHVIAKRFWKVPELHFLAQILEHRKSPQRNIREAAVRTLGVIGIETRAKQKLSVISAALKQMTLDEQPSVRSLALRTTNLLEAVHARRPSRWSLREGLRRVFRACCSSAEVWPRT